MSIRDNKKSFLSYHSEIITYLNNHSLVGISWVLLYCDKLHAYNFLKCAHMALGHAFQSNNIT